MKKIINSPEKLVDQMLDGLVKANPNKIERIPDTNVIARIDSPVDGKVGIISGGGSGHEPAHAGYVGRGMLDCAVAGEVFHISYPRPSFRSYKKS